MQSASCHSRLYKDISELLTTDFECSSASVIVHQTTDSISEPGSFTFEITVKEGPYRNAVFTFGLSIPPSYPFKPVVRFICFISPILKKLKLLFY